MGFFKKTKVEDIEFPKEIEINDFKYGVEVIFSPKKSSSGVIRENKMIFRLSSYLSKKQAEEHFSQLLKKLSTGVVKNGKGRKVLTIEKVIEKGEFMFANTIYKLEFVKTRGVKLIENTFLINYNTKPELLEKYIIKYLILRYTQRIEEYVKVINERTFGFKYGKIELKSLNSKWGHCTHKNDILFNLKLLNAPIEVFDYVIIHELAHIKVKNHSDHFWREVVKFCPDYKKKRKVLKHMPPQIYQ